AMLVLADFDKQLDLFIFRQHFTQMRGRSLMIRLDNLVHHSTCRAEHIDARVVVHRCQFPRKDNVSIQNGARFICHRLGHVVTFDQYGVKGSDRAFVRLTGTLH
ncbi:hypothetical protein D030_4301B, partial [Vibrio parahaemolyticus AQ3810]